MRALTKFELRRINKLPEQFRGLVHEKWSSKTEPQVEKNNVGDFLLENALLLGGLTLSLLMLFFSFYTDILSVVTVLYLFIYVILFVYSFSNLRYNLRNGHVYKDSVLQWAMKGITWWRTYLNFFGSAFINYYLDNLWLTICFSIGVCSIPALINMNKNKVRDALS